MQCLAYCLNRYGCPRQDNCFKIRYSIYLHQRLTHWLIYVGFKFEGSRILHLVVAFLYERSLGSWEGRGSTTMSVRHYIYSFCSKVGDEVEL